MSALACAVTFLSLTSVASATVVPQEDDLGGEIVGDQSSTVPAPTGPTTTIPSTTIPVECVLPTPVLATFVGTVVASDRKTARFQVVQMRGGTLEGYVSRALVDIDYGTDVRFLDIGETYIVATGINAANGRLFSKVREPEPLFGSSQVIGLSTGVNCPEIEDAVRTLNMEGRTVESGVLAPLGDARGRAVRALLLPLVWVLGILIVLATLRNVGSAFLQASYRYWNGEPVVKRRAARR